MVDINGSDIVIGWCCDHNNRTWHIERLDYTACKVGIYAWIGGKLHHKLIRPSELIMHDRQPHTHKVE